MAEEHVGPRPAAWTKIFGGFKVALDLKKLLLAAAGILLTALGWWALSWVVYYPVAAKPNWSDYSTPAKPDIDKNSLWTEFKARRASWNLLHALAGPGPMPYDAADVAATLPEYDALDELLKAYRRNEEKIKVAAGKDKDLNLEVGTPVKTYAITIADEKDAEALKGKEFALGDLKPAGEDFMLGAVLIKVTQNAKELRDYRKDGADLAELDRRVQDKNPAHKAALKTLRERLLPNDKTGRAPEKPGGLLRTLPWFENRGENPYLLVSRLIKETHAAQAGQSSVPPRGDFLAAFREMIPVLLEPIVKILTPVVYLFNDDADWYVKIYLILVLLYALAVWAFFGGAITRLAAVQVARNEKIPLREALVFAKDRFVSFFAAPAFPLLLLGILVLALWLFGWVEGFIPIFGDIVVAGVLWPIVLVVGLIMAVVLVGLVGWPLMNATISVEGSDSFDALSRSYSYVYQAPWQYLWYGLVATVYGAALVFFVGFMASLIIFLGKWGVGMAPGISKSDPRNDREPSYLFRSAPTSFGWRDLLIHNNQHVHPRTDRAGVAAGELDFSDKYVENIMWYNSIGGFLVSFWIYLFFLLVVGFGYSYFWSASTIIYFLMRRHVDDTDMDEVHLEEDEALDPFTRPPAANAAAPSAPPAPRADRATLSMVDAPALRPSTAPAPPPPAPPPTAPLAPPPTAPLAPPLSLETPPPPAPNPNTPESPPSNPPGPPPGAP